MELSKAQRVFIIEFLDEIEASLTAARRRSSAVKFKFVRLLIDPPRPERSDETIKNHLRTMTRRRETEVFLVRASGANSQIEVIGWLPLSKMLGLSEGTLRSRFSKGNNKFSANYIWYEPGIDVIRARRFAENPAPVNDDPIARFRRAIGKSSPY